MGNSTRDTIWPRAAAPDPLPTSAPASGSSWVTQQLGTDIGPSSSFHRGGIIIEQVDRG